MKNTKAPRSSSTSNRWGIKIWLFVLSIGASTYSYTCGPEYDSLGIDMISNMGFDPVKPSRKDVSFLWHEMVSIPFYKEGGYSGSEGKTEKEETLEFNNRLNQGFVTAGRQLKIPIGIEKDQVNQNPDITMVDIEYPGDSYNWGICASNNRDAYLVFIEAAIADKSVTDTDLITLISLRSKLIEACSDAQALNDFKESLSSATDTYRRYLLAISHFYSAEFEAARNIFIEISQQNHSLSEVSIYLIGRTYLRENQPKEEYLQVFEDPEQQEQARKGNLLAVKAFESYLKQYPSGVYANSAEGLIRRAQWFAGNQQAYSELLQTHIDQRMILVLKTDSWTPQEQQQMELLMGEYQRFMPASDNQLETLSALLKVVKLEDAGRSPKHKALADLKSYIALYGDFQSKNYAVVIQRLTDQHKYRLPNFLLLTRALETNGDWQKAIELWREVRTNVAAYSLKENASNEIARILVAQGGIEMLVRDKDFDHPQADYLWETNRIKSNYLSSLCGSDTQLAWLQSDDLTMNSRNALVADIATRHLYAENFVDLNKLFSEYSDEVLGGFSGIRTAVRQVAEKKQLGKAYMNIGYFMQSRISPIAYLPVALREIDEETGEEVEQSNCSQKIIHRQGGVAGPYYYYSLAMNYFDQTKNTDEAKTLHFLTMCFKTGSAYADSCLWGYRGNDKQLHSLEFGITSEQAFKRLHKKYPGSEWAEKTPYHY